LGGGGEVDGSGDAVVGEDRVDPEVVDGFGHPHDGDAVGGFVDDERLLESVPNSDRPDLTGNRECSR
jgi:hypothetical protein